MSSRLEELERQHHILSVLYQVYGEMSGAATLDDAVKKLLQYARQEAGAQTRGFCAVLDDEGALAQVRASTEEDGKAARGTTIDLLASPLRALIGLGGLHVLEEREALRPFLPGTKSQLILPISHDGAPVAFLDLEAREPGAFARVDGYFFEKLAEQAGTILHTRNDLSRSQKEIDLLWDVGAVADASQELDQSELPDLLAKVLEIALGRLRVKNGTIFLVDEDTGDLIVESRSLRGDFLKKAPLRLKRRRGRPSGIAFWVVEHNKPYATGNIDKDPNYAPLFRGIRSNVAVPIPFQDRAIGAIVLESVKGDAFTSEDVRVLEELARQAAKFVRRAQLYQKSREKDLRGIMIRGLCPEWEEAEELVERVSPTSAPVLLRGESGTGKELIANAIHFNSRRSRRQFVVVNCAAIPGELLESELFGHAKGAFTGATFAKIGEFEKADGGTLFLDEIGDLTLPLQVKLLRALQSGEIARIGGSDATRKVDVRVIAATNRDLEAMIREGRFREDLYYRLNLVQIWLPPLRKYRQSIPGMVKAFVEEAARVHGKRVKGVAADALAALKAHDFPGNVRELKNVVERAVILETGEQIHLRSLPSQLRGAKAVAASPTARVDGDYKAARRKLLDEFEDRFLRDILARSHGNIQKASRLSGINRVSLHKLLSRRGIEAKDYR